MEVPNEPIDTKNYKEGHIDAGEHSQIGDNSQIIEINGRADGELEFTNQLSRLTTYDFYQFLVEYDEKLARKLEEIQMTTEEELARKLEEIQMAEEELVRKIEAIKRAEEELGRKIEAIKRAEEESGINLETIKKDTKAKFARKIEALKRDAKVQIAELPPPSLKELEFPNFSPEAKAMFADEIKATFTENPGFVLNPFYALQIIAEKKYLRAYSEDEKKHFLLALYQEIQIARGVDKSEVAVQSRTRETRVKIDALVSSLITKSNLPPKPNTSWFLNHHC